MVDPAGRVRVRMPACKTCTIHRNVETRKTYLQRNPECRLSTTRRWTHGVTEAEYAAMWDSQRGCCDICRLGFESDSHAHIDHDHGTGKIRALLCTNCNRGLGYFQDSPELLVEGAEYLRRHATPRP